MWKRTFDRADATVGTRINEFVRSENFATLTALTRRAQREMQHRIERNTRRTLHLFNLPAGSDVKRLLSQIALLEREVRDLRKELADRDVVSTGEGRNRRAPTPRRRSRTQPHSA